MKFILVAYVFGELVVMDFQIKDCVFINSYEACLLESQASCDRMGMMFDLVSKTAKQGPAIYLCSKVIESSKQIPQ